MPRALLSVSDKSALIPFATALVARGYELVSTGGTAAALAAANLPVIGVADITGFPEMLDGRVKTLHPRVHGGILARRDRPDDLAALAEHGISLIDMVVVNLYPFAAAAAKPDLPFDHLIEEIDIGGPSMVRAAAKNFRDVLVVVEPHDYDAVITALDSPGGLTPAFRFELARKAFAHTARYDQTISGTLAEVRTDDAFVREQSPTGLPLVLSATFAKVRDLRYGENPHQVAAWYAIPGATGLGAAAVLQGKELSYTNLLDLDAAARIVLEFDEPAACVIKHTNPSGVATAERIADAYCAARDADPLSAFGGIVGLNRTLDEATAAAIATTFIECVIVPGADPAALAILAAKPNLRVVVADFSRFADLHEPHVEWRSILGGPARAGQRSRGRGAGTVERCDVRVARTARGDGAPAVGHGVAGVALCLARLCAREVEHDRVHVGRPDACHRRRPDEPRRLGQGGDDEGHGLAGRIRRRIRRVLPVPRRDRCGRGGRCDRGRPARGIGA